MADSGSFTYKDAGVDIDAGDELVERIKPAVKRTVRPEVIGGLGGFGGLFRVPQGYKDPVLVSGTDGVGTKLNLAIEFDAHDEVGIDLVAMCVNDVVVVGAEPLFFLDYYSTPRLDVEVATRVVSGIAYGCELAGCTLLGGETAEHPGGTQSPKEYDIAGFCVGIVERDRLIDGRTITAGDTVIGVASSGVHSNGFSLVRHILKAHPEAPQQLLEGRPLIEHLLTPTKIYVRSMLKLARDVPVKGFAHITGGGLLENIPRVLPAGLGVELRKGSWQAAPIFGWLESVGVAPREMHRTFNCGVGMVVAVDPSQVDAALASLGASGERASVIGRVIPDAEQLVTIA
jgi:phosphoribosylformylglycinamidine cyclo-ligase